MNPLQHAFDQAIRHQQVGQLREAEAIYRQILAADPNHPDALHQLGVLAMQVGRNDVAVNLLGRAVALNPSSADFQCNFGSALQLIGRIDESIAAFQNALRLRPEFPEAQFNLGNSLRNALKLSEAIEMYRGAVALDPAMPEAHYNLSTARLLLGDFDGGWEGFEYRWKIAECQRQRLQFGRPPWDGVADLRGRRILVHSDDGLGDFIQFCRYVPLLAHRGAEVILGTPPELMRLMRSLEGVTQWISYGETLPPFDVDAVIMDMPKLFRTNLQTIPASTPYLRADPTQIEQWRDKLKPYTDAPRIGLAWAGRAKPDPNRSIPFHLLAPLAKASGVTFVSLQKNLPDSVEPPLNRPSPIQLLDWTSDVQDLADTAALIANLDLVITIDTAVAHLAGALGKPAWVLLPRVPEWRWMIDRSDSPWYPTLRLFRQPRQGDWPSVIAQVVEALQQFKIERR